MQPTITSEVVVAYTQCPRKAYLLLFGPEQGTPHEYIRILERQRQENHERYVDLLRLNQADVHPYTVENLRNGRSVLLNARLQAEGYEAACSVLRRVEGTSSGGTPWYEPTICVGTYSISTDQKRELVFAGYVLANVQHTPPVAGSIISVDGRTHTIKLDKRATDLVSLLVPLRAWTTTASPEPPPIILNKHCPLCPFQRLCHAQAEQEDNLSLLDSLSTPKMVKKYARKGIFTVNQLSYLYRPRKQRKRSRKSLVPRHDVALQALVIRTGKIFILRTPELSRQPVEIFLDIEGIPDQHRYYLMGLFICEGERGVYHALWADTGAEEERMWHQFLALIQEHPDAPLYHYGSYESKAIATLGRRYQSETARITPRLVNVNAAIYGKVYFPLRSNRLKDLGAFLGASWSASDASGLQSLVWRDQWETTRNMLYRQRLITYNEEDCRALKLLTDVLSGIQEREDAISDIDYYIHAKKSRSSTTNNPLHDQLETILKFAHSSYKKHKIHFHKEEHAEDNKEETTQKHTGTPHRKKHRKPTKLIQVPQATHCPTCGCDRLSPSKKTTERLLVDLTFTPHGVRKSIAKYWAYKGHCPTCRRDRVPPNFSTQGRPQFFGVGFKVWLTYLRVALRLPYGTIHMIVQDMFNEDISDPLIIQCLQEVARYHSHTEKTIFDHLLESPYIHVDETQVNIDDVNQYIWVFTDGKHVIFKYTETREADFLHEFLDDYPGILISDFFPGYDSLKCRHQKCLVHIIRDMNNDLWASPFDSEYAAFVVEVKNLIVPIMETIQSYGLKKRHLSKFTSRIDIFYKSVIEQKHYSSELCAKYQQRFLRYRKSLFTFLEYDGIPWHNNTAESAIRHLPLQQRVSGVFHASVMREYLILLGVKQTCRFQEKSFLKFLLSGEQDVDKFRDSSKNTPVSFPEELAPPWKKAAAPL